jgi:hypothetical protein
LIAPFHQTFHPPKDLIGLFCGGSRIVVPLKLFQLPGTQFLFQEGKRALAYFSVVEWLKSNVD